MLRRRASFGEMEHCSVWPEPSISFRSLEIKVALVIITAIVVVRSR